jgi:hypothetical protein
MPISVRFVRKDTGLPDDSMPEQIVQSAVEAVELVRAHKAGAHGDRHILQVSASRSALSRADRDRLIEAGAEITM